LHPINIADGFELACDIAVKYLESIAEEVDIMRNNHEVLIDIAKSALCSKVVSKNQ